MLRIRGRLPFAFALVALSFYPLAAHAQYKLKELRTDPVAGTLGSTVFPSTFLGSNPDKFIEFQGNVYFFARFGDLDGQAGLYRTDGTTANTVFVAYFDAITDLAVVNGWLLISGANESFTSPPLEELELWGTPDGSTFTKVKDLRTGGIGSNPSRFYVWGNRLLFAADPNGLGPVLCVSEWAGTEWVTTTLDAYKDPQDFVPFGTKIFFTAKSLQTDAETRLWSWGGDTGVSAELVEDRVVGNLAVLGTSLFMTKRSGTSPRREGELWRTDGVPSTAVKVSSLWPGGHAAVSDKTVLGSNVYFFGCNPALGRSLYRTDGTAVTLVKDFLVPNPIAGASPLAPANSCDVDYPTTGSDREQPNGPNQLTVINGKLYFEVDDGENGRELWSSDGTTPGTTIVANINPGIESSDILINAAACGGAYCRAVTASGFYFTAVTRDDGRELWYCDGTTVTRKAQIDPTRRSGLPVGRLVLATTGTPVPSQRLFFSGSDDDGNAEPWVLPLSPTVRTSNVRVLENAGTVLVPVSVTPAHTATVVVNWATVPLPAGLGAAIENTDYTGATGTLTFAPGGPPQTISVPLLDDAALEGEERFVVRLTLPSNAALPVTDSVVTIADDAADAPSLEALPAGGTNEGSSMPFVVRLTGAHADNVYVNYRTIAISATSPADFAHRTGTLTFGPVAATPTVPIPVVGQTVNVATVNDTMAEDYAEPIALEIFGARGETVPVPGAATRGATIITPVATSSILDWDAGTGGGDYLPGISVGDRTVTEDNVFADIAVILSNPSDSTVRVYWSTPDSVTPPALPATPDVDFRNASGVITFRPGQTSKTITLDVYEDGIDEGSELAYVELDPATALNGGVFDGRGVLTITDDEAATITLSNATVTEGDSGNVDATFTISLSMPFYQAFTVDYATTNGTATAGLDYVAQSGTVSFPKGTTQRTVTVPVIGDVLDEPNETFRLTVSGSTGPDSGASRVATATITDDDTTLSVSNASATEANTGTNSNLTFTVSMPEAYRDVVTVTYTTSEGGGASLATSGVDFLATTGTVTIAQGAKTATFTVPAIGDVIDENAETFLVTLSNSSGPLILDGEGIGTINDNDTATISVNSVSVPEGNTGTTNAVFTMSLSVPYYREFSVDWATSAGTTNPATPDVDFTTSSGTVTFPALSTSQTISVPVIGDAIDEPNETFRVTFSNSTGPGPTTGSGTGTITDDDALTIGVADVSVVEGNSGTRPAVFTLTLSGDHTQTVTVSVTTTGGGPTPPAATAGTDYTSLAPTTITFAPGVNSQTVSVNVIGDTTVEANNESFGLALSGATGGATLARTKALGIILDDDSSRTVALNPLTVSVQEPASGTTTAVFTVALNAAAANTVTVDYTTANGTATAGSDYTGAAGTLSFDAGESSKAIAVVVLSDGSPELRERFTLTISNPTNATLVTGSTVASATITDPTGPVEGGFFTLTPCRVFDSRNAALGGPAPLAGGSEKTVALWNQCSIPSSAKTVSVNVTVTGPSAAGYLTIFPSGVARPKVSVINYSRSQTRANNAVVQLGATGDLAVYVGQASGTTVHAIIDVNGYLE